MVKNCDRGLQNAYLFQIVEVKIFFGLSFRGANKTEKKNNVIRWKLHPKISPCKHDKIFIRKFALYTGKTCSTSRRHAN